MKKVLSLFFLFAMILGILAGCQASSIDFPNPNVLNHAILSQETKDAVDRAIRAIDSGFVNIDWDFQRLCYGRINRCIIVNTKKLGDMYPAVVWSTKVGNYVFEWGHPIMLYAFKDGEVCTLSDAYKKDWLNDDHIRQLHDYHEDLRGNFSEYLKEYLEEQKET